MMDLNCSHTKSSGGPVFWIVFSVCLRKDIGHRFLVFFVWRRSACRFFRFVLCGFSDKTHRTQVRNGLLLNGRMENVAHEKITTIDTRMVFVIDFFRSIVIFVWFGQDDGRAVELS